MVVFMLFYYYVTYTSTVDRNNFFYISNLADVLLPLCVIAGAFVALRRIYPENFNEIVAIVHSKYDALVSFFESHGSHILLLWILFVVFVVSWEYGLLRMDESVIALLDHPWHYYEGYYTVKYLIPIFHSVVGWNPFFNLGYPIQYFYHPGLSIFISITYFLSNGIIPLSTAYRIYILTSLLLPPFSAYFLAKKFGFSRMECAVVGLVCVIPTSRSMELIRWGMVPLVFASGLSPLVFAFLHDYLQKKKTSSLMLSAILLGAVILTHFIVSFAIILGVLLYALLLAKYSAPEFNARKLAVPVFLIFLLSSSLSLFWSLPSGVYYMLGYGKSNVDITPGYIVKTFMGFINYHLFLLSGIPLSSWIFMLLAIKLFHAEIRRDFRYAFLCLYPLVLYVVSFYGSLPYSPIQNVQLLHLISYIDFYAAILIGLLVGLSLKLSRHIKTRIITLATLILAVAVPLVSVVLSIDFKLTTRESVVLTSHIPQDTLAVFGWLKNNADPSSRVLLEDAEPIFGDNPWGRGYNLALAALSTGDSVRYCGGFMPFGNHFYHSDLTQARAGFFFGKHVDSLEYDFLTRRLRDFNVRYVVVWTLDSKCFLNQYSGEDSRLVDLFGRPAFSEHMWCPLVWPGFYAKKEKQGFRLVGKIGKFSIYEFLNASQNFVASVRGDAEANITFFGVDRIVLHVEAKKPSTVVVSSAFFPDWRGFVVGSGVEVPVFRGGDGVLTEVSVPAGVYDVELVFRRSWFEEYSMLVSLAAWIVAFSTVVILLHRERHVNVI